MEEYVAESIKKYKEQLVERWMKEVNAYRSEQRLQYLTDDVFDSTNRTFILLIIESVACDESTKDERIKTFARELIELGWPLQYLTRGLQTFKSVLLEELQQEQLMSNQDVKVYTEIQNWIDSIINQLIAEYTGSWERSNQLQRMALKELSAPLIPIVAGISVMPLIGTVDTDRAKMMMENLLNGVIKYESQVVLIDITGVPIVDTMVAHHLIQASDAVRLVGADSILVGIRPEIAQTIVNLGIELGKYRTTSSLQRGVELALSITGRKLISFKEGGSHDN